MIEHMVIFKFKPETTTEQKEEGIRRLRALKTEIAGIADLQANHNFSPRSQGFDMGLTVRFENKQALEEYGPNPKHQAVVSYLKEIGMIESIVVDFEI